jgi:hypothetical protein
MTSKLIRFAQATVESGKDNFGSWLRYREDGWQADELNPLDNALAQWLQEYLAFVHECNDSDWVTYNDHSIAEVKQVAVDGNTISVEMSNGNTYELDLPDWAVAFRRMLRNKLLARKGRKGGKLMATDKDCLFVLANMD